MTHTGHVISAFLSSAKVRPSQEAWITLIRPDAPEQQILPAQLIGEVEAWARLLSRQGIAKGEHVAICLDHSLALYASFLGVMMAGGTPSFFAPPSVKQNKEDQEHAFRTLLTQSGARFLICEDATVAALAREHIVLTPQAVVGATGGDALSPPVALASDVAFIQYSSGTTGLKKGVAVTHGMLMSHIDAYAASIALSPSDKICSWLPLYHDMGLITAFFLPLLKGVSLIALSPFDWVRQPAMLLDTISRHRATLCWQPNFAYKFLTKIRGGGFNLSSMRLWVNCSEPVLHENHKVFLEAFAALGVRPETLGACYAMAETVFAVTSTGANGSMSHFVEAEALEKGRFVPCPGGPAARAVVSSGRALPGTSVKILNPNQEPLPEGILGHIAVKTPSLFTDYLGDIRAAFSDGHFLTGDTGFLYGGELFVLGREKDIIIVAGRNLYPQDLEAVVDEVAGVIPGRCTAFGVSDSSLGTEALVLLVEAHDTAAEATTRLARDIAKRIVGATGVAPAVVQIKPHMWLKKSTSGKISRRLNRERFLEEARAAQRAMAAPQAAVGEDMAATIRRAVKSVISRSNKNAEILSDTDSFFELGLIDSLSFIELVTELEQVLSRPVPPEIVKDAFKHDSIAAIVARYQATPALDSVQVSPDKSVLVGAKERRQQLSPQFADTDKVRLIPVPYIMLAPQAHYVSPSANTDEMGFRLSFKNGARVSRAEFMATPGKKGIILGNSVSWGTGASHDINVVHNVLNRDMPNTTWFSLALRMSTLTQERLSAELFAPLDVDHVVWITGGLFIMLGLSPEDHSRFMPFPSQAQFEKALGLSYARPNNVDFTVRLPQMLQLLERELALLSRVFGPRARSMIFAIQPAPLHYNKPLHPKEKELLDLFFAMPGPLKDPGYRKVYQTLLARIVEASKTLCPKHGIQFVDISESRHFNTPEWLFVDTGHMSDAGHVALANAIRDNLK